MGETMKCELCGEPMPQGEEMFKFHGYSGPCPAPPLPRKPSEVEQLRAELAAARAEVEERTLALASVGIEEIDGQWCYTSESGEQPADDLADALQRTFALIDRDLVAECDSLRVDLTAVEKLVQLQADRDWIIAPWLNEAGDYVWRVNVRDTPSKKRGADTYTGTAYVGATALDAGLRALAAQEGA